jgi:hypothetical protein
MAGATHLLPMYDFIEWTRKTALLTCSLNIKYFSYPVFEVSGSGDLLRRFMSFGVWFFFAGV